MQVLQKVKFMEAGISIGDWTTLLDYMMADDPTGDIANDYALSYYPTIYKICPDRMVTEVGQLGSVSGFYSEIQSCSQATFSKDMKILEYNGVGAHCNGTAYPSVKVQNYSLGSNVYSFNVKTLENGQEINSTPWSGNLSTYETANVSLGPIDGFSGNTNLTFEVEYEGDQDSSNNTATTTLSTVSQQSSADVTLNIETDNWGYETSWSSKICMEILLLVKMGH